MGYEVGKYKLSSDFGKMSEEGFIEEWRKRFKATKKEAKEVYNELHGHSTRSSKKNSPSDKKSDTGSDSVPGVEEVAEGADPNPEGEAQ